MKVPNKQQKGGRESHFYRFANTVMDRMSDDLYCFKANGLAFIIMYKRKPSSMFKIVTENSNEDDIDLHKVANKIRDEIKQVPTLKNEYPLLDQKALSQMWILMLENLLALVSPKFGNSKQNALLSSMIASNVVLYLHTSSST